MYPRPKYVNVSTTPIVNKIAQFDFVIPEIQPKYTIDLPLINDEIKAIMSQISTHAGNATKLLLKQNVLSPIVFPAMEEQQQIKPQQYVGEPPIHEEPIMKYIPEPPSEAAEYKYVTVEPLKYIGETPSQLLIPESKKEIPEQFDLPEQQSKGALSEEDKLNITKQMLIKHRSHINHLVNQKINDAVAEQARVLEKEYMTSIDKLRKEWSDNTKKYYESFTENMAHAQTDEEQQRYIEQYTENIENINNDLNVKLNTILVDVDEGLRVIDNRYIESGKDQEERDKYGAEIEQLKENYAKETYELQEQMKQYQEEITKQKSKIEQYEQEQYDLELQNNDVIEAKLNKSKTEAKSAMHTLYIPGLNTYIIGRTKKELNQAIYYYLDQSKLSYDSKTDKPINDIVSGKEVPPTTRLLYKQLYPVLFVYVNSNKNITTWTRKSPEKLVEEYSYSTNSKAKSASKTLEYNIYTPKDDLYEDFFRIRYDYKYNKDNLPNILVGNPPVGKLNQQRLNYVNQHAKTESGKSIFE